MSGTIDHTLPHLSIRASAGTGKTFQLATRYLRLVMEGRDPGRILATTFTRKAAGEVLGRVLSRLAGGAASDEGAARLAGELAMRHLKRADFEKALMSLARQLHRMGICTIDSFFGKLCNSFRHELRLPHPLRVIDDASPLARELKLRAIQAVLDEREPAVLLDLLQRLHHDGAKRSVTESLRLIVDELYGIYLEADRREAWTRLREVEPPAQDVVSAAVDRVAAAPCPNHKNIQKMIQTILDTAGSNQWDEMFEVKTVKDLAAVFGSVDGSSDVRVGEIRSYGKILSSELVDALIPLVRFGRDWLLSRVARRTAASYDFVDAFAAHYSRLREEHRVLLFSDLTYKLLDRFNGLDEGDLMDIYFRIDSRIDHLLLDEFQDTSTSQWKLLGPLASEVTAELPAESGLHARTYFCVGDTKQAIYGWRGGCAEIFSKMEEELFIEGPALASLSKSFRSSQIVLDVVNEVFSKIQRSPTLREKRLDAAVSEWVSGYGAHSAARELPGFVELRTTRVGGAGDDNDGSSGSGDDGGADEVGSGGGDVAHLEQSADFVRQLVREHPGRSIGVLTRRRDEASKIIDLLRRRGVEASGEGGAVISGDAAVAAVLAAMRLADHPGEAGGRMRVVDAFHVFHTPLRGALGLASWEPAQAQAAASRLRARLVEEGYAPVVTSLASALASSGLCDEGNLLHLSQLVELADAYEPDATLRPKEFVAFVEHAPVETTRDVPVRVMTIHKSKGLEFDLVVLCDLDSRIFAMAPSTLTLRDEPTGPIREVYVGTNKCVRQLHHGMTAAFEEHQGGAIREAMCVLYVAMTRAKHALHMLVRPPMSPGGKRRSSSLSLAQLLRDALRLEAEEQEGGGEVLFQRGVARWDDSTPSRDEQDASVGELDPTPPRWSPRAAAPARSLPTASPSSLESEGHVRAADLLSTRTDVARLRGSVIHAWFSEIEFLDPAGSDCPIPNAALSSTRRLLVPGVSDADEAIWMPQFLQMLGYAPIRKALARPAVSPGEEAELWRERAFVVSLGDRLLRGVFDRVAIVRDASGRAVRAELLDYKTDTVNPASLEQVLARYRPQMGAYARALRQMLGLDAGGVSCRLLFVGAGIASPVDVSDAG